MEKKIFVTSAAFGERRIEDMVSKASSWGYANIELTAGLEREQRLLELLCSIQSSRFMVHNYFPRPESPFVLNLASLDPPSLQQSIAHCRLAIDICERVGCKWYSVHAGFAAKLSPEHLGKRIPQGSRVSKQQAADVFQKSVEQILEYAKSKGIGILVENNVVEPHNLVDGRNEMLLLAEPFELSEFVCHFNDDSLGLLVDLGHLKVSSKSLGFTVDDFIRETSPYCRGLHISDNDGVRDSNQAFDRESWIPDAIRSYSPEYVVIEVYNAQEASLRESFEAVRSALSD